MTSPFTQSGQAPLRLVTVLSISTDGTTALCADKSGNQVGIPLMYQKAKGILPLVGEQWAVSNATGIWCFDTFYGNNSDEFPGSGGSSGGGGSSSAYAQSVFGYTGTPGPGNLPVAYVSTAGRDPYGNTLPYVASFGSPSSFAVDGDGNAVVLNDGNVVAAIAPTPERFSSGFSLFEIPFLIYSGEPTTGNLIISMAGQAGVDNHGNRYPAGFNGQSGIIPAGLLSGTIPGSSNPVGGGTSINFNPYFSGGDLAGWAVTGGIMNATQTPEGPYPWGVQLVSLSAGQVYISQPDEPVNVVPDTAYMVSGWANINAPGIDVLLGITWLATPNPNSVISITETSLPDTASIWNPLSAVFTSPPGANYAFPIFGCASSTGPGMLSYFQGVLLLPSVPGGLIQVGTITAAQLAAGIIYAGIVDGTTIEAAQFLVSGGPGNGIFVYSSAPALGNLIGTWSTLAGTDDFGNNFGVGLTATQGTLTGMLAESFTIQNSSIMNTTLTNCSISQSAVTQPTLVEPDIQFDTGGGRLLTYDTTTTSVTFNTVGTFQWTCPAGVFSVRVQVQAGGASGGGGSAGLGGESGGGAEYAEEPSYPVIPGNVYSITVGAGGSSVSTGQAGNNGQQSGFDGQGVVANPGLAGSDYVGGLGGGQPGGPVSTNTIHFPGGNGASNTDEEWAGGAGGGGGAGSTGAGSPGTAPFGNSGQPGGSGGPGSPAGGPGGFGGSLYTAATPNGTAGAAPGAGGGGCGASGSGGSGSVSFDPVETKSFLGSGALRNTDGDLYQNYSSGNPGGDGDQFAYWYYNGSSIASALSGKSITSAYFNFTNLHSWYDSGMYVVLGAFSDDQGVHRALQVNWVNEGANETVALASGFGGILTDGSGTVAIALGPGGAVGEAGNLDYYGYQDTDSGELTFYYSTGPGTATSGAGASGQVILTYVTGSTPGVAISGVAGNDGLGDTYGPGITLWSQGSPPSPVTGSVLYGNANATPALILPSGLSGTIPASQTDVTEITVTTAGDLSKVWDIPAGDAKAGTVYRLTVWAVYQTTGQPVAWISLTGNNGSYYIVRYSGNLTAPLNMRFVLELPVLTTGTGGTCVPSGTWYIASAPGGADNVVWFADWATETINTTIDNTLALYFDFAAGGSITSYASLFERLGP